MLDRVELEGRLALADGRHLDGARMLRTVAAELADSDPPRAVRLYVAACYVLSTIGHAEEALELARMAADLPSTGPVLDLLVASAHAEATAASGRFTDAERMFRELAELGDRAPEVHADREARLVLVEALYGARQFAARQIATAAARDARIEGALGTCGSRLRACSASSSRLAGSMRPKLRRPRSWSSHAGLAG